MVSVSWVLLSKLVIRSDLKLVRVSESFLRPKCPPMVTIWPEKRLRHCSSTYIAASKRESSSTIRKGGVLPYFDLSQSMSMQT